MASSSHPNVPVVNAGALYVNGLALEWALNTAVFANPYIVIDPGASRDVANINDIILSAKVNVVPNVYGANGVDINAFDPAQFPALQLFASSFYAVYIIGDSKGYKPTAGMLSLASGVITLPLGYDMYRRIGWVKSDASRNILSFVQYGASQSRQYWWTLQQLIAASAAVPAVFTATTVNNTVPPASEEVVLNIAYNPAAPANFLSFLPFSAPASAIAGSEGSVLYGVGAAGNSDYSQLTIPLALNGSGVPSFYYRSTSAGDSVTISAAGYKDYL